MVPSNDDGPGEYIRDNSLSNDECDERLKEFVGEMTDEVRNVFRKPDLEEDDYWIDSGVDDVGIRAGGWVGNYPLVSVDTVL